MGGSDTGFRPTDSSTRLVCVWHERYHCPEAGGLPSTVKQKAVVERATELDYLRFHPDARFDADQTWALIEKVHSPAYVRSVRTGDPRGLAQSQGFRWCPELVDSVCRIWSGHVHACRLALRAGLVFHPVSGAHHARRAKGGGFCTFNYLIGAARVLNEEELGLGRIMIVDLDTHQGNGTWELAHDDARLCLFDLSGADFGVPETESTRRFYRIARDADEYFRLLPALSDYIEDFRPQLIQFQAGMDCHETDILGGIPGMTAARLFGRDAFVFQNARSKGIPVVFNLAGGYQDETTLDLHLGTIRAALASDEGAKRRALEGA